MVCVVGLTACATQGAPERGNSFTNGFDCDSGDPVIYRHRDYRDTPGGPASATKALEDWLTLANSDVPADQFAPVSDSDAASFDESREHPAKVFQYERSQRELVRFAIEFVGDSWHMSDFAGCFKELRKIHRNDGDRDDADRRQG